MSETQPKNILDLVKKLIIPPATPTVEDIKREAQLELAYDRLREGPSVGQLVKDGTLTKPDGVTEGQFGHALIVLQTFFERRALGTDQETLERLKQRVRDKVGQGKLPSTAIDLLNYEEEPTDWRE